MSSGWVAVALVLAEVPGGQAVPQVGARGHRAHVLACGLCDVCDFIGDVKAEDVSDVICSQVLYVLVGVNLGSRSGS